MTSKSHDANIYKNPKAPLTTSVSSCRMTEVMNSLEAGAEDFGGDGAGAGDEGAVSFQASL